MLLNFPSLQVPGPLTKVCSLNLDNNKRSYAEIFEIIEKDPFLNLYVHTAFSEFIKDNGILGMLSALGWDGLRNRLAEAYLYYYQYGRYPKQTDIDEVYSILDLEKRYDFLYSELSSRVFLLGFYLKVCAIWSEKQDEPLELNPMMIPSEVDEILILGKSKNNNPDWLIVAIWSFFSLYGKDKTMSMMTNEKEDLGKILKQIPQADYEKIILSMLKYGYAIQDETFFSEERV